MSVSRVYCSIKLVIAILFFAAAILPCRAQNGKLFNSQNRQQLFNYWYYIEITVFYRNDSAHSQKILDSIIAVAQKANNKDLEICTEYEKLEYDCYHKKDIKAIIEACYAMAPWINSQPYQVITAIYQHGLGNELCMDHQYSEGFHLMLQAQAEFEKIGLDNIPDMGTVLYNLSSAYYAIGDYTNAAKYGKLSEKYHSYFPNIDISKLNTEGLAYRNLHDYDKAMYCLQSALDSAKAANNTVWFGLLSGNIGYLVMLQGDYSGAINYLLVDYNINHLAFPRNTALTSLRLALCYTKTNQPALSRVYFGYGLKLRGTDYQADYDKYYLKYISQYYFANKNFALSYKYSDSMLNISDSLYNALASSILTSAQKRIDTEGRLSKLALEKEAQKNRQIIRYIIIISITIALCILLFLLYVRHRAALQKQLLLQAEKRAVEEKLHNAETQLGAYIKNLSEKNELLIKANAELEELQKDTNNNIAPEKLETLSTLFIFTILTDEDWQQFKALFDQVYPFFFTALRDRYPEFTPGETRLLALLKLDLSNKQIAAISGVSADSVRRSKLRLRKKMADMDIDKEIDQFVKEQ